MHSITPSKQFSAPPRTLLAILFLTSLFGTASAQLNAARPENLCAQCKTPTGGGGGGTLAPNYALNWSELEAYTNVTMGGIAGAPYSGFVGQNYGGRQGPAATAFGNSVYVAYTSITPNGGTEGQINYVYAGTNGNFAPVNATNGSVASNVNPALVTVPGSFANIAAVQTMVLAVGTGSEPGYYSGSVDLLYSNTQATEWTYFASTNATSPYPSYPNAVFSPSLAYDKVANILYLGYTNANDNTLVLCKTNNVSTPLTCNLFPSGPGLNFNPGMAVFNNTLYIALESQSDSHELQLYTSTDQGQSIQANDALGSSHDEDQTSVAPFLLNFNDKALYVGFRTNDNNQYFVNRYSTDGVTFLPDESIDNPWPIGSTPILVDGNQLNPKQNVIFNFFGSNDGNANLYSFIGQP